MTMTVGCRFLHLPTILIPEASVTRNDNHAGVGHAEATAVFFKVVTDLNCRRDVDVFVDDHASEFGMPANIDAIHQNAIFDVRVAVDPHFRREDRVSSPAATTIDPWEMIELIATPTRPSCSRAKTFLAGGYQRT